MVAKLEMSQDGFDLLKLAQSAVGRITVRSALNPLIWFSVIMATIIVAAMFKTDKGLVQDVLLGLLCILVVAPIIAYAFFALTKPDYLRSEAYHMQKHSLEMMGTKAKLLDTKASHIVSIATSNPEIGEDE